MDMPIFSIASIKSLEVIDINSGAKLGFIKDLKIDCDNHKVISIIIPSSRVGWFSRYNDIEIEWSKIRKIGIDVVLVEETEFKENF